MKFNFRLKPVVAGLLTYVPPLQKLIHRKGTGGTNSASYCYGVWMKHLVMLWEQGMRTIPDTVAELGPGDSLGIGFAALLSGVRQCTALDVEKYGNVPEVNLAIFDELVKLFQTRASRPTKGWPDFDEYLDERLFPSHILTPEVLAVSLAPERIAMLRSVIEKLGTEPDNEASPIRYMVPWTDISVMVEGSIDVLLSQSVLEHVSDLETTYKAFRTWVKPGGYLTHQVDFSSHSIASYWNGHWAYPEFLWKIMLGRRGYLLNREPASTHIRLAKKNGFEIIKQMQFKRDDGLKKSQLASVAAGFSEDDVTTASMFFQARKPL